MKADAVVSRERSHTEWMPVITAMFIYLLRLEPKMTCCWYWSMIVWLLYQDHHANSIVRLSSHMVTTNAVNRCAMITRFMDQPNVPNDLVHQSGCLMLYKSVHKCLLNERLHKSWIIMITVFPILLFNFIVFIKRRAWWIYMLRSCRDEWIARTFGMNLLIYVAHSVPIFVNHEVDQRSHENKIMLILGVMLSYRTYFNRNSSINERVQRSHGKRIITIHFQLAI
jgi:hypothetical protein